MIPMAVSPDDREFMQRVGAFKAESHAGALAKHRALSLAERVARGLELSLGAAGRADRPDDPSPFYARARELGLYRPRT